VFLELVTLGRFVCYFDDQTEAGTKSEGGFPAGFWFLHAARLGGKPCWEKQAGE
jgi:hypothetical protein